MGRGAEFVVGSRLALRVSSEFSGFLAARNKNHLYISKFEFDQYCSRGPAWKLSEADVASSLRRDHLMTVMGKL